MTCTPGSHTCCDPTAPPSPRPPPDVKPTFIYIGPDKAGSTWLYEILRAHPRCFVPACKDIYFFDRYYHRGLDWYLSFFQGAGPGTIATGELSHDYLFSDLAARRIARDLPDVTLLTTLRDPAERTFAHYLHMIRSGRTRASFEEALERFPQLLDNSRYHRHLSRYFEAFERDQIRVLFFEDLQRDPTAFAKQVFDSLRLPFLEGADYGRRVQPTSRPRSTVLARAAKLGALAAREIRLTSMVGVVKRSRVAGWLYKPYDARSRPRLEPEMRRRLVELTRDDAERLQDTLGVDLGSWLATDPVRAEDADRYSPGDDRL